jgi:hypothetical protein
MGVQARTLRAARQPSFAVVGFAASIPAALTRLLQEEPRVALCASLTLLLLLLYSPELWYVNIPLSVIALGALILPTLRTAPLLWGLAALITGVGTYRTWYTADNHKYLLAYWCLALFVALITHDPQDTLRRSARSMIALVFGFAVVHKTLSGDYLNGSFFYYELLLDERFSVLAKHVAGVPNHFTELNEAARRALISFDSTLTVVPLRGTRQAAALGAVMTWWNYGLELLIVMAFLAPSSTWLSRSRDVWLLLFLFTTYVFAPVIGFGWVLAIMGIAQTDSRRAGIPGLYVVVFLLLQMYRIPWAKLVNPDQWALG